MFSTFIRRFVVKFDMLILLFGGVKLFLDGFQDEFLVLQEEATHVGADAVCQLQPGRWHVLAHLEHHVVGYHILWRFIFQSSNIVSKLEEGLEHRVLLDGVEGLVAANDHEVVVVLDDGLLVLLQSQLVRLHQGHLQVLEGRRWVLLESFVYQLLSHHVVYIEEVVSVFPGVLKHLLGEGALSPVSQLVLLVCQHSAVVLEEESQAEAWFLQDSRCLSRVKHIDNVEAKVFLEPLHIVVSSVQHLGFAGVVEEGEQGRTQLLSQLDSVHYEVMSPR